jgi:hypothetical protein
MNHQEICALFRVPPHLVMFRSICEGQNVSSHFWREVQELPAIASRVHTSLGTQRDQQNRYPGLPAIPVLLSKSETKHSVLRRCFETLPSEVGL